MDVPLEDEDCSRSIDSVEYATEPAELETEDRRDEDVPLDRARVRPPEASLLQGTIGVGPGVMSASKAGVEGHTVTEGTSADGAKRCAGWLRIAGLLVAGAKSTVNAGADGLEREGDE